MTPARRILHAAAPLAALALALAACTGGVTPPAPAATPEASSAAEAPSTPAPTAEASPTPAPAPTPEPPPEQACANGVAVAEPEARPGLVADCVALLASRDALRGEAALDWGGDLAIGRWEGVAVEGEPPRVVRLDLRGKGLTGAIPRGLGEMERLSTLILVDNALTGGIPRSIGRLGLDEVRLAGNELTGCVPSAFGDARGDASYLGLPWCLRYALDATGEVAEAGGWAILGADGEVLATWEGLRSEAATLRVHQTDAGGTSWAPEFGAVAEGDLFEWRKASDCWVRYHVTGPPVRPASGSGRWEFPVEWMTYAATGEDCTGAVGASAVLAADEAAPTVVPAWAIASPVRHGIVLLSLESWEGGKEASEWREPLSSPSGEANGASGSSAGAASITFGRTSSLEEARRFRYWRDPVLPPGWTFGSAEAGGPNAPHFGYCAAWANAEGYWGVRICVKGGGWRPWHLDATQLNGVLLSEPRVIDGRPAIVQYAPRSEIYGERTYKVVVWIFDTKTGIEYAVRGADHTLRGSNTEAAVAIARSLLPD